MIGENAAQKITQPMGWSSEAKNRITIDQLSMSGPGAARKFCEKIRRKKRQTFIAEKLENYRYYSLCSYIQLMYMFIFVCVHICIYL